MSDDLAWLIVLAAVTAFFVLALVVGIWFFRTVLL